MIIGKTNARSLGARANAVIGMFSSRYTLPISAGKRTAVQVKEPLVAVSSDSRSGFGLGDVSLRPIRIFAVTRRYRVVGQAEASFDTADSLALGKGTELLKLTGIYATFWKNGSMLAPALVHTERIGARAPGRGDISNTVFDLYHVPRLRDPRWYVTLEGGGLGAGQAVQVAVVADGRLDQAAGKLFDHRQVDGRHGGNGLRKSRQEIGQRGTCGARTSAWPTARAPT